MIIKTDDDLTVPEEVDAELVSHVLVGVPLFVGQDVLRLVGVRALDVSRPYLHTQHMSCRRSCSLREPSIPAHTTHVLSAFELST